VAGPVLIFELFVRSNPVASFWLGREAEPPRNARAEDQPAPAEVQDNQKITVNQ
jgi:hypothetical protein